MSLNTWFAKQLLAVLFLALAMSPSLAFADLWLDGGFESNFGWDPKVDFVGVANTATDGPAPNDVAYYTLNNDNTLLESGKWVEDASRNSRAFEGERMYWLRPYADPDTICVGQRFTNILQAGQTYELSYKFAAFDEGDSNGLSGLTTKPVAELTSYDPTAGTNGEFVTTELAVSFSYGSNTDSNAGTFAEFDLQAWNNITWMMATATFVAPNDNGQAVYVWASMTNDSNGMLIDGITLRAVPEPTAGVLFASIGMLAMLRRRRRQ